MDAAFTGSNAAVQRHHRYIERGTFFAFAIFKLNVAEVDDGAQTCGAETCRTERCHGSACNGRVNANLDACGRAGFAVSFISGKSGSDDVDGEFGCARRVIPRGGREFPTIILLEELITVGGIAVELGKHKCCRHGDGSLFAADNGFGFFADRKGGIGIEAVDVDAVSACRCIVYKLDLIGGNG